ncbi:MAG: hypothetical protein KatS3mg091_207 [Patescibacteria group bacterium]|nr:MAG: hypothetical protein KatS3mg091_207 [Patescibacteria group bacterium]
MNKIKLYLLIFIAFVSIIVIGWYINSYLSQSRANNQSENYITGLVRHQTFLGGTNSNSLIDVNDFQLNTETSTVLYYPLQVRNWTAGGNLKQWSSFELYNPNNNPVNAQVFIYGVAPDNQGSAFTVTIPAKSYIRSQDLSEFNNLISGYPNGRVFWVKIFFPNANNGLLGINKWRLVDGTKTNAPIVDTDISNLQTKSEKNLVAPLITIKGSTTMSNATQWTDIIVVNVKEDQARIRITFNGKIGQNNTVQTKRIEKTIERYGYYSTYGDQSWYNLFKDNNGQIQSATGWARVDVIGGNGEIIGLTRSRILNGQSYNSPLIYVNDENLVIPQKELYVPLAFFGYESGMPDHTQWTNIVISNLLDETNKVNFEYIPLTGENLNKSSFSVNIEPKGQYNSYGRTEWLNLAANGRKYGWIKITSDQLNQAVLVGMARWTLRSGSESRNSARIVSDMVLTSKIQGKTYVPFSSQPQQIASGSLQYEKYNFVVINTNQNVIRLNLALSGSNYNFNNLLISAYGLFNFYSNSSLQQINYTGWGEVSVLAVNPTNTPTAVPTSFYRTCDNNRCVVRTGTPPANTRTCSTDADCLSRPTNTPTIAVTNTPTAIPSPTRATGTGTGTGNIAIGFNRYQVNYLSGSDEILYDSDDFQFNAEPSSVLYYPLVVRDWTGGVNLKQWSSFELYNPNNERVSVSFMFYDANVNGAGNPSVFSISMNPNSRLGLDNNNEYQTKWNELLSGRNNGRLMWAKIVTANSNHKIIGINKWRLIDTSKTSRQIVDNEINNLHTKARASWVVPFVVIKESTSNNNDTQWTDLVIANVTRNNARVEIDFVGKIGSNSAIQTKRLELNIGPYGYYGTYGDNKWYDLFSG